MLTCNEMRRFCAALPTEEDRKAKAEETAAIEVAAPAEAMAAPSDFPTRQPEPTRTAQMAEEPAAAEEERPTLQGVPGGSRTVPAAEEMAAALSQQREEERPARGASTAGRSGQRTVPAAEEERRALQGRQRHCPSSGGGAASTAGAPGGSGTVPAAEEERPALHGAPGSSSTVPAAEEVRPALQGAPGGSRPHAPVSIIISCGKLIGRLDVASDGHLSVTHGGQILSGTEFERLAGQRAEAHWQHSCVVVQPDKVRCEWLSVAQWLKEHHLQCLAVDEGLPLGMNKGSEGAGDRAVDSADVAATRPPHAPERGSSQAAAAEGAPRKLVRRAPLVTPAGLAAALRGSGAEVGPEGGSVTIACGALTGQLNLTALTVAHDGRTITPTQFVDLSGVLGHNWRRSCSVLQRGVSQEEWKRVEWWWNGMWKTVNGWDASRLTADCPAAPSEVAPGHSLSDTEAALEGQREGQEGGGGDLGAGVAASEGEGLSTLDIWSGEYKPLLGRRVAAHFNHYGQQWGVLVRYDAEIFSYIVRYDDGSEEAVVLPDPTVTVQDAPQSRPSSEGAQQVVDLAAKLPPGAVCTGADAAGCATWQIFQDRLVLAESVGEVAELLRWLEKEIVITSAEWRRDRRAEWTLAVTRVVQAAGEGEGGGEQGRAALLLRLVRELRGAVEEEVAEQLWDAWEAGGMPACTRVLGSFQRAAAAGLVAALRGSGAEVGPEGGSVTIACGTLTAQLNLTALTVAHDGRTITPTQFVDLSGVLGHNWRRSCSVLQRGVPQEEWKRVEWWWNGMWKTVNGWDASRPTADCPAAPSEVAPGHSLSDTEAALEGQEGGGGDLKAGATGALLSLKAGNGGGATGVAVGMPLGSPGGPACGARQDTREEGPGRDSTPGTYDESRRGRFSSLYHGVSFRRSDGMWQGVVPLVGGKQRVVGRFLHEMEAVWAVRRYVRSPAARARPIKSTGRAPRARTAAAATIVARAHRRTEAGKSGAGEGSKCGEGSGARHPCTGSGRPRGRPRLDPQVQRKTHGHRPGSGRGLTPGTYDESRRGGFSSLYHGVAAELRGLFQWAIQRLPRPTAHAEFVIDGITQAAAHSVSRQDLLSVVEHEAGGTVKTPPDVQMTEATGAEGGGEAVRAAVMDAMDVDAKAAAVTPGTKPQHVGAGPGSELIGRWVACFWDTYDCWFIGVITHFSSRRKMHKVRYIRDDEREDIQLPEETVVFVEEERPPPDFLLEGCTVLVHTGDQDWCPGAVVEQLSDDGGEGSVYRIQYKDADEGSRTKLARLSEYTCEKHAPVGSWVVIHPKSDRLMRTGARHASAPDVPGNVLKLHAAWPPAQVRAPRTERHLQCLAVDEGLPLGMKKGSEGAGDRAVDSADVAATRPPHAPERASSQAAAAEGAPRKLVRRAPLVVPAGLVAALRGSGAEVGPDGGSVTIACGALTGQLNLTALTVAHDGRTISPTQFMKLAGLWTHNSWRHACSVVQRGVPRADWKAGHGKCKSVNGSGASQPQADCPAAPSGVAPGHSLGDTEAALEYRDGGGCLDITTPQIACTNATPSDKDDCEVGLEEFAEKGGDACADVDNGTDQQTALRAGEREAQSQAERRGVKRKVVKNKNRGGRRADRRYE
ncbi:hypothetical protein CYMTET_47644 [Cymbomonas tetramitiformis]|uniref:Tudor domain-containing protein n=1 Tax=Cymbomonas tetramitiformis TaxID=36881 RepID=A0AAE0BVQ8_9CHLO|nr:hypothetical protein CYMTET_47644 [Cymbomonas tetramitiformis]